MSKKITVGKCRKCKVETEDLEEGLCEVCKEIEVVHQDIANRLRTQIQDPIITKEFLETIDELTELSKESQWRECKGLIINAMFSEELNHKTAWRLFVILQNMKGQSQHVEEWEKDTIEVLRKVMKYSIGTIAFIVGRSKETISRQLKEVTSNDS